MSYINQSDRDNIAVWFASGVSLREIGRRLNRNHGVISREISRNMSGHHYIAIAADAKAHQRKKEAGEREPLKNGELYAYVLARLRDGWSPEQISGKLRKDYGKKIISYEAIYLFIYKPENKHLKLWQELPRGHAKRRQWHGRSGKVEKIPSRVSIHDRPEEIEDRLEFGHWEGDSVIGKGKHHGIHTEVERTTRYLKARLLPKFDSASTVKAQAQIFESLPLEARKTVTLDLSLIHI